MTIEKLTEENKAPLPRASDIIIDTHEADRAALVEQAAHYKRESECLAEALASAERDREDAEHDLVGQVHRAEARVRELTEALAAAGRMLDEAEARVRELEKHFEYHRSEEPHLLEDALRRATDAESHCRSQSEDIVRLRASEKAAAESISRLGARNAELEEELRTTPEDGFAMISDAAVAADLAERKALEARVRELEKLNKQNADVEARVIAGFQARLAAATALLERAKEWVGSMRPHLETFLNTTLTNPNQPAAPHPMAGTELNQYDEPDHGEADPDYSQHREHFGQPAVAAWTVSTDEYDRTAWNQPAAPTRTVARLPARHIPEDQLAPIEAPARTEADPDDGEFAQCYAAGWIQGQRDAEG